jgi:hypothetical protein
MKSLAPIIVVASGLLTLAACELPTAPPRLDQRWILPVEQVAVDVDDLLPDGMTSDGTTFSASVPPVTVVERLTDACAACADLHGAMVPKPGFADSALVTTLLPPGVAGATLQDADVELTIHNDFGFDPIRPGGAANGTITVELRSGEAGVVLGRLIMDGASESLPPGATVTRTLRLGGGVVGSSMEAVLRIDSPAGTPAMLDASDRLTVMVTPTSVRLASAIVDVSGEAVTLDPVALDVADLGEGITDHIDVGTIVLDVANPFGVAVEATLEIRHPDGVVTKALTIPAAPSSTVSIPYTPQELRSFLGRENVTLTGSGAVSATAGTVTLVPGQRLVLDGKIDLSLTLGG